MNDENNKIINNSNKKIGYTKLDSFKMFLWCIKVVALTIFLAIYTVANNLSDYDEFFKENQIVKLLTTMVSQFSLIVLFFVYNRVKKIDWIKSVGFSKKFNYITILITILISIICVFGCSPLIDCFDALLRLIGYKASSALPLRLETVGDLFINILFLAIVPSFVEELIFRGLVFNGLNNNKEKTKISILKASLLAGIIFALIHSSPQQTVYPFILGTISCLVFYYTGNLWYSIILHFVNNLIVVVESFLSYNNIINFSYSITWWYVLIAIFAFLLSAYLIYLLLKLIIKIRAKDIEKEQIAIINDEELKNIEENKNDSNKTLSGEDAKLEEIAKQIKEQSAIREIRYYEIVSFIAAIICWIVHLIYYL
jgi:membrane protease YdiL (CAAX protease family)